MHTLQSTFTSVFSSLQTRLNAPGEFSDGATEHLLRVLGENIHPKRLQRFDDIIKFDLERAATEYGDWERS